MRNSKFCDQCNTYGHSKWLFLGTHKTHRLYIRWKVRQAMRKKQK